MGEWSDARIVLRLRGLRPIDPSKLPATYWDAVPYCDPDCHGSVCPDDHAIGPFNQHEAGAILKSVLEPFHVLLAGDTAKARKGLSAGRYGCVHRSKIGSGSRRAIVTIALDREWR